MATLPCYSGGFRVRDSIWTGHAGPLATHLPFKELREVQAMYGVWAWVEVTLSGHGKPVPTAEELERYVEKNGRVRELLGTYARSPLERVFPNLRPKPGSLIVDEDGADEGNEPEAPGQPQAD